MLRDWEDCYLLLGEVMTNNLQQSITWISVSDELPDDDMVVLVFIEPSDEAWIAYKDGDDWRGTDAHHDRNGDLLG